MSTINDLAVARQLADAGIPIFASNGRKNDAFYLPQGWQNTKADPEIIDTWDEDRGLALIGGHGIDVIDWDLKNDLDGRQFEEFDQLDKWPTILGQVRTRTGGMHYYVHSLGIGKTSFGTPNQGEKKAFDFQAGNNGKGNGFVWMPPTIRPNKQGELTPYEWVQELDMDLFLRGDDGSGNALKEWLENRNVGSHRSRNIGRGYSVHNPTDPATPQSGPDRFIATVLAENSGRNDATIKVAGWMREHRPELTFDETVSFLETRLFDKFDQSGDAFTFEEFERTVESAFKYPAGSITTHSDRLDDFALVDWVSDELRSELCWSAGMGWMKWYGKRWASISDPAAKEMVRDLLKVRFNKEVIGGDYRRVADLNRLNSANTVKNVTGLLMGALEVESTKFDQQPDLLNVANGVLDLSTKELSAHDPSLYFTKITEVNYRPDAVSSDWDKALSAIPEEVQPWFQIKVGQAVTGHPSPDDVIPFLKGSGSNGKSTVIDAISSAIGEFVTKVSERAITGNLSGHSTELMPFRGARLAILEELPEKQLSIKRLKDLAGTESITARKVHSDNVTFSTTHSLFVSTNYYPGVAESDNGTWRRFALVDFPRTYGTPSTNSGESTPGSNTPLPSDQGLRTRIKALGGNQEAVLAWLVEGAYSWYQDDRVMPQMPDRVTADTRVWREREDQLLAFASEHLVFEPEGVTRVADFYATFNGWQKARGQQAWTSKTLSGRIQDHSEFKSVQRTRRRVDGTATNVWVGMSLAQVE